MKFLALVALLTLPAAAARAQDLNGAAGADAAQAANSLKKQWSGGAQAAEFKPEKPQAEMTPQELLSTWSHACPAIAVYLAKKSGSKKKGLGITTHYRPGPELMSYTGSSWYYTWTAVPASGAGGEFVPLLQYPRNPKDHETLKKDLGDLSSGTRSLLGFNEPDLGPRLPSDNDPPPTPAQAEAMLRTLLPLVPRAVRDGAKLGSPALASPVIFKDGAFKTNPWLTSFTEDSAAKLASAPDERVDFVAAHFYAAIVIEKTDSPEAAAAKVHAAAHSFAKRLQNLEASYPTKEIWITEMGLMDLASKSADDARFGPKDDACFMAETLTILDADPRVARYAWFNADPEADRPKFPTLPGTLFSKGKPTPLALLYKQ